MQVKEVSDTYVVLPREEVEAISARVRELEAQLGQLLGTVEVMRRVLARIFHVATAPCYLRRGERAPRFVMNGREVLDAMEAPV